MADTEKATAPAPAAKPLVREHIAAKKLELWQSRAFLARYQLAGHEPMSAEDFDKKLHEALHGGI